MKDLNELLQKDEKAKKYYMTLSEELQGGLTQFTDSIHTYQDMVDFVEKHNRK